jgi:hypothetical protein
LLLLLPIVACQKVQDNVSPAATAHFSSSDCLSDPDLGCFMAMSFFEEFGQEMSLRSFQTADPNQPNYYYFFPVPENFEYRQVWSSSTSNFEINWYHADSEVDAFVSHIHPDKAGAANTFTAYEENGRIICGVPAGGCFSNTRPLSPIYPINVYGFDSTAYHIFGYLD